MSNANNAAANKITFSKMESHYYGDDGHQDILLDGKNIGEITRSMDDVGSGMAHEYRVGSYEVSFFDIPGLGTDSDDEYRATDVTIHVVRRQVGEHLVEVTARSAHTAAKNYARSIIKAALIKAAVNSE